MTYKMKPKSPLLQKAMKHQIKSQRTKTGSTETEFKGFTFSDAFSTAREGGFKTFKWKGKKYHTKTKEEV